MGCYPKITRHTDTAAAVSSPHVAPAISLDEVQEAVPAVIDQYLDVFDVSKRLRPMKGPPLSIKLHDDIEVRPYRCINDHPTPLHQLDESFAEVKRLETQGVIAPQKDIRKWLLPEFFVGKPDRTLRLVVNAKPINQYIYRPAYPFNSPDDCLRLIPPDAEILIVCNAKKGYFQIHYLPSHRVYSFFCYPRPLGPINSSEPLWVFR